MAQKKKKYNTQNLIPLNKRTKKEQREIAKKGAKKSIEVRQAKRTLKDQIKAGLKLYEERMIKAKGVTPENKAIIKEAGLIVYNLLIALQAPNAKVKIMAANSLMDRLEGRAKESLEITEPKIPRIVLRPAKKRTDI